MKFHWGHGVGILYCTFVVFILLLVYKSTSQDFSLVTKNYYEDELKYQVRIDKAKNSASLDEKLNIELLQHVNKVRISFPKHMPVVKGEILFYRPSDSSKDVSIPVQANIDNYQDVSCESLQKGLWRIQVDWTSGDKSYFDEKPIVIQ